MHRHARCSLMRLNLLRLLYWTMLSPPRPFGLSHDRRTYAH